MFSDKSQMRGEWERHVREDWEDVKLEETPGQSHPRTYWIRSTLNGPKRCKTPFVRTKGSKTIPRWTSLAE